MAQPRFINLDEQAKLLSLTTPIIADGAITTPKIADGAITDINITPGTIGADKFAPAVFGAGLVYNSLTNAIDVNVNLADLDIDLDAITIPDGSLEAIKLAPTAFGEGLIYNIGTDAMDINVDNVTLRISSDVLGIKPLGVTVPYINIDTDLSFNNHQALSFRLENLTTDPAPGNVGRLIWRTDTGEMKVDNGIAFINAGGHNIQDEGVNLPQRPVLDFIGTGVTVTDTGTKTQVDIPGNAQYIKDNVTVANPIPDHTIILTTTPLTNSELVSWNGLFLRSGATNDYTISTNVVTLNPAITLTVGDEIQVSYAY